MGASAVISYAPGMGDRFEQCVPQYRFFYMTKNCQCNNKCKIRFKGQSFNSHRIILDVLLLAVGSLSNDLIEQF